MTIGRVAIRALSANRLAMTLIAVLAVGVAGWWVVAGDSADTRSPDRRIIDAARYAGADTRTDQQILQVADNVCASLRQDQSLVTAHGTAGRQLLLNGKHPRRWLRFIYASIDNRCPDVDDAGLIDNDEGRLTSDYR